jgi:hypothetical protein
MGLTRSVGEVAWTSRRSQESMSHSSYCFEACEARRDSPTVVDVGGDGMVGGQV